MNHGFFDLPSAPSIPRAPRGATGCEACGLYRKVKSPRMPMTGEGKLGAFLLGEGPGETEDGLNKQFVGQAGDKLRLHLKLLGYDLDRDFFKQNAIQCRPTDAKGNNRPPISKEIQCCEQRWRSELNSVKHKFIFLTGAKAVEAFFMYRTHPITTSLSIGRFRKLCIPDIQTGAWILPLYHSSFVVRNPDAEPVFKKDLTWALSQLSRSAPTFPDYDKVVIQLTRYDDLIEFLDQIIEYKYCIAIDYETSGLKPFKPGHQIRSISIARYQDDYGYSFPYQYPSVWGSEQLEQIRIKLAIILSDPEIPKVAQNIQMEHPWSKAILGVEPRGWVWDTMVYSHIEDERPEYTGLDFQVFINWGYEYGSDMVKYKKPSPGSIFNTMHKAPLSQLLSYGGKDAYFTMRLAERQWSEKGKDPKEFQSNIRAYELFHEGTLCFSDMTEEGIGVNVGYYQQAKEDLENRQIVLMKRILQSDEAHLFKANTGREIDIGSPDDLNLLLHKFMGIKASKFTIKGNVSTDASVLESIDLPFTNNIVKMRKIQKNKVTYIEGILDEEIDGRIHPDFNLHLVRTYRSSSSNINFHNLPKRDLVAMSLVRGGIIPSPGNQILEADYGGHEIRIVTCYTKDPEMIWELENGVDIHQEWSIPLGIKRFDCKNAFIFAEIYGSFYKNVWADLTRRGYNRVSIQTVQKVESDFWKKYKATKKFQEKLISFYKDNAFVEMFHGFRRRGFLTRNEIINTPVQGTAFHLLLWSCIQINKIRKLEGWLSKLIGQIHDSIIMDVHPSELDHVVQTVKRVMTEDIRKVHPWIIVPLLAEVEVAGIDQPWHTKSEYEEN